MAFQTGCARPLIRNTRLFVPFTTRAVKSSVSNLVCARKNSERCEGHIPPESPEREPLGTNYCRENRRNRAARPLHLPHPLFFPGPRPNPLRRSLSTSATSCNSSALRATAVPSGRIQVVRAQKQGVRPACASRSRQGSSNEFLAAVRLVQLPSKERILVELPARVASCARSSFCRALKQGGAKLAPVLHGSESLFSGLRGPRGGQRDVLPV
jgi:hypothetical protein